MSRAADKLKGAVAAVAGVAAVLTLTRDEQSGEVTRAQLAGATVFRRDARGRPIVLGVAFPRVFRGKRGES